MGYRTLTLLALLSIAGASNAQWTVRALNTPGASYTSASAISASGVAGQSHFEGQPRAGYWSLDTLEWNDLHGTTGGSVTRAFAAGGNVQAGYRNSQAALWRGTPESIVDLHLEGAEESRVWGTDGVTQAGMYRFPSQTFRACMWMGTKESWVDLHPAAATWSIAQAVDGDSQVGGVLIDGIYRAALWHGSSGSWQDLSPAGALASGLGGVYGDKQVGGVQFGSGNVAGLWSGTPESFVSLHPAGAESSGAVAIFQDWQAGTVNIGGRNVASFWSGTSGSWNNLDEFLPPGYDFSSATSIWSDGTTIFVAGYAQRISPNYANQAFLWTRPVPEPSTILLLGAGVSGFLLKSRARKRAKAD